MNSKNKKIQFSSLEKRKKEHEKRLKEQQLKNRLLGSPELFNEDIGSNEYLDALSIKLKLIGGRELTYGEYISEGLVEYRSHFPKKYYYLIAKLYNIPASTMDNYIKPQCTAHFTIQFIYGRFPKRVVDTLMRKAPWTPIPGVREIKLFQNLSSIATEQLDSIIIQCIELMEECDTLSEFKLKYSKRHRIYFQTEIFTNM